MIKTSFRQDNSLPRSASVNKQMKTKNKQKTNKNIILIKKTNKKKTKHTPSTYPKHSENPISR